MVRPLFLQTAMPYLILLEETTDFQIGEERQVADYMSGNAAIPSGVRVRFRYTEEVRPDIFVRSFRGQLILRREITERTITLIDTDSLRFGMRFHLRGIKNSMWHRQKTPSVGR